MSSKLCPGTPQSASSSVEGELFQAHRKLHSPWTNVTLFPYFPVILLNFIPFLRVYTSVHIPQLQVINMEPMACQVRHHYSQKTPEAHHEKALAHGFKNTVNFHCWLNVWTPTQPLSIVLVIANIRTKIGIKQDNDDTN